MAGIVAERNAGNNAGFVVGVHPATASHRLRNFGACVPNAHRFSRRPLVKESMPIRKSSFEQCSWRCERNWLRSDGEGVQQNFMHSHSCERRVSSDVTEAGVKTLLAG